MKIFFTIILTLAMSLPGYGQEREIIKNKGKTGYWFSVEVGDKILGDLIRLPNLEKQNLQLTLKLEAKDEKISLMNEKLVLKDLAIENEAKIGKHWKEAYIEENTIRIKENQLCEKKLASKIPWYKRPGVVFFGGTLIGAALAVGIAFGINWAVDKEI